MRAIYKGILLFFCVIIFQPNARSQGMWVPVQTRIQTPYGPTNITTQQYMPMPMQYARYGVVSGRHSFVVRLKNGEVVKLKGRIDISDSVHVITYKEDKEKSTLKPTDTREVFRFTDAGKKLTGIPTDSCWLFKIEKGAINAYAYVAEEVIEYVVAIQEGDDGAILPLDENNLVYMVGDDPKAVKLARKKKFTRAISVYNERKKTAAAK